MAELSRQPLSRPGLHRLLHRANRYLPGSVVFVVLSHERRRIVHFNVTEHPSAEWTAQQMVNAFPWDTAPRYLIRDRDQIYGGYFGRRVTGLGIEQVLTAPRSPWQSP